MPINWIGTTEERYARLDRAERRCDGNNRRCVHGAVERYTLAPAKDWEAIPDAEQVTKLSCSRHRQQFINNPNYVVLNKFRFPPAGQPQSKAS